MNESTLWDHLRPHLQQRGKFQKISDRFSPGVPDMLGMCDRLGRAWEFKELEGVIRWKTKFRPLQLDWLRDWEAAGGQSLIVSSHRQLVLVHRWQSGALLEAGAPPEMVCNEALLVWPKTRVNTWSECVNLLLGLQTTKGPLQASEAVPMPGRLRKRRSGPI